MSDPVCSDQVIALNLHKKCKGFYTRILNDQKSAIDYSLLSTMMFDKIYEVSIDEAGQFDVDSDHVLMSLSFYSKTVKQANSNKCKPN